MSFAVPEARIRNLREAFVKVSEIHGRCWVCLTMPEKGSWPKEPHWLELVHPDRLEDDSWGREVWGRTLGYVAGAYKQPFRFELYDNWAVVFYHSRGVLEDRVEDVLRILCEQHIDDARTQLDELATEAVACFGLRNDSNPFTWTDDAYKWLWRVFEVLDPATVLVPMPMGDARWKVRKLTYNVFQASVVAIDILLSQDAGERELKGQGKPGQRKSTTRISSPNDVRDKWIYEQCVKGVAYEAIAIQLRKKPKTWDRIESKQGIRAAAQRYANKRNLPPIPARQNK